MAEFDRDDVNAPLRLAYDAFKIALKHIRDTLEVESGDLAADYWSGRAYQPVLQLTAYARAEIEQQKIQARKGGSGPRP